MNIHDPAWPEQRANIHRALEAARTRDAFGVFAGGWLLSTEKRPARPREDRKQ